MEKYEIVNYQKASGVQRQGTSLIVPERGNYEKDKHKESKGKSRLD